MGNLGEPSPQQVKGNKYGARKIHAHGLTFDSEHEYGFWKALKMAGIQFEFQKRFELLPTLKYKPDEKATAKRSCKIDFWLPLHNLLVDTKGVLTDGSSLRLTLLKHVLYQNYGVNAPAICLVKTGKTQAFISIIKGLNYQLSDLEAFRK